MCLITKAFMSVEITDVTLHYAATCFRSLCSLIGSLIYSLSSTVTCYTFFGIVIYYPISGVGSMARALVMIIVILDTEFVYI